IALLAQTDSNSSKRSTAADGCNETVDLAVGLSPDFLRCGGDVSVTIGNIVELIGPDRAIGLRFCELFSQPACTLHVVVRVSVGNRLDLDQLCSHQAQSVLFFFALRLGNDDHRPVAESLGHQGEADTGIPGSPLNNDATWA